MINHISIGVRDAGTSKKFYDAILQPLGYRCLSSSDNSLGYGRDNITLWINSAERPVVADSESGLHFCFNAPDHNSVRAFYDTALRHGGHDNGAPGLRSDYHENYYAAFVIDPDGYRLEALCESPQ